MKFCPKCKAQLDDSARFCLHCMTSLEEKEQILPPARKSRRWPFVLIASFIAAVALIFVISQGNPPKEVPETTELVNSTEEPPVSVEPSAIHCSVDGVTYYFRPATKEDHPTAISLENHYVLIAVNGTPSDGIYRVPSFVGDDMSALVSVVADGAFTDAQIIDLGYNVRYVWGNAFGSSLTDLYLHEDVLIARETFSGCSESLTIHCPSYIENTQGVLWSELAVEYGFHWQNEVY